MFHRFHVRRKWGGTLVVSLVKKREQVTPYKYLVGFPCIPANKLRYMARSTSVARNS